MIRRPRPTRGDRIALAFYLSELVQLCGLERAAELIDVSPQRLRFWLTSRRRLPRRIIHQLLDRLRSIRSGHVVPSPTASWNAPKGHA